MNQEFLEQLWDNAHRLYRDMPWRSDTRPYYVFVSELMLQQTQVTRVVPKFEAFLLRFPDEQALAKASLAEVLREWQGLGYNRRAKFVHEAAKKIMNEFGGVFPTHPAGILSLPGVGKNTLGAIEAYAFNRPSLFIETNIRTVYIHHFFPNDDAVMDSQIVEKLAATIDREHPREFYWALMDYGTWLKASGIKNNSQSKHYTKQSPLEGSVRQVRGQILRVLAGSELSIESLQERVRADERFDIAYQGLLADGLITVSSAGVHLTK